MSTKTKYPWVYINDACIDLASKIKEKVDIKYVIGIARGGLIPATLIAKHLDVREVLSFGLKSYNDGDDYDTRIAEPQVYQDIKYCYQLSRGENILIVDDITDKGNTLELVTDSLQQMSAALNNCMYTASIFQKPGTSYQPSFTYACVPDDEWVVFPWEK